MYWNEIAQFLEMVTHSVKMLGLTKDVLSVRFQDK